MKLLGDSFGLQPKKTTPDYDEWHCSNRNNSRDVPFILLFILPINRILIYETRQGR